MDDVLYQRPREKLLERGVASLSTTELLQIIVGSGNPQASAAKIARSVNERLSTDKMTYDVLTAIPGVGTAKACQLLAVIELCERRYAAH